MPRKPEKKRGVYEYPAKSGVWWICYFDQYRKRHREKVGPRSRALEEYEKRKTEVRLWKFRPEDVKGKHQACTVADIIRDFKASAESRKLKSVDDIKQRLAWWETRLGSRDARSIVKKDIEDCRLELSNSRFASNGQKPKEGGRSVATVNRYLATLKSVFLLAIENDKLEKNPFKKVKLLKEENERIRILTEEEEARLFAAIPTDYHALVTVALHTGMRKGELLALKWRDVDFKKGLVTVRKSKSGKARHIGMTDLVVEALQRLPRMLHNPFVFPGEKPGQPMKNGIKHSDWVKYLQAAGIENLHWHDLRHTFASWLVMEGVDLYKVKQLLGHESIEMTQRYAHLAPESVQREVDVLMNRVPSKVPSVQPAVS